jgi:hypothetical protein
MISKPSVSEQPGQHGGSMVGNHLVYEWLLPVQSLDGATGRQLVFSVQLHVDDFWKQIGNRSQAQIILLVSGVLWLTENELSCVRIVSQIKPLSERFIPYA